MANQAERAYYAWEILSECAREHTTVTYGELAHKIGIHHRPIGSVLKPIQDYCLDEKLPPLTILVVTQNGTLRTGFVAWDVHNLKEGLEKVFAFQWDNLSNPFSFASNGEDYSSIVLRLMNKPESASEIYAQVKVRGTAQIIFRQALQKIYRNKCTISGIAIPEVLEAVHIIPWSKCNPADRLDPRNGLFLTSLHHKLFDSGRITLTTNYQVLVSDELRQKRNLTNLEWLLVTDLHQSRLRLPDNKALWPSIENIQQHAEHWAKVARKHSSGTRIVVAD